jgi:hypothetical protein
VDKLLEITGVLVMMLIAGVTWGIAIAISLLKVCWFASGTASTAGVGTLTVLGILIASAAFNPEESLEGPKEVVDTEVGGRLLGTPLVVIQSSWVEDVGSRNRNFLSGS